ncbi:sulfite exporter TauE/SafE [Caballeronia sordidicola]|uniref:Probable membrane transporter protein n=1 Tax=Caballeronia sordidicola TaxID=196367 RepID=A0A158G772_CABSO|nr:sulfite exporter TauE/SafE family protein [Caballeronia sordidicola]SAL27892.1 sulfite exporter TauE/SafE [Caballeronia sordidicola]
MTSPAAAHVAIVGLTFLIAGTVKGVTGMGLPTVAMGVLGTLMLPAQAATLLILPSLITNVWQLFAGPGVIGLAKRFWPMMAGIVAGTIGAASFIAGSGGTWAVTGLGAALTLYAMSGLFAWRFAVKPEYERRLSPAVGIVTGLITGGTGVFVVPAVPYLQALDLKKEDLVQALGLSFTVSTVALAIGLARENAFAIGDVNNSLLAVVPALLGMWIGQHVRERISPATFRRWFFICLLALGLQLLLRHLI